MSEYYNHAHLERILEVDTQSLGCQVEEVVRSPQQNPSSIDYGVIVCEIMTSKFDVRMLEELGTQSKHVKRYLMYSSTYQGVHSQSKTMKHDK